ncbi:MAG TPA: hypothetical protein VF648_00780 [Pyrinomonadaceae bacterium]|jgi:hypothetical protein
MYLTRKENRELDFWIEQPKGLPFAACLAGGVAGGLLILVTVLSTFGGLMLFPFVFLAGGLFWLMRGTRIGYFRRFLTGVAAFMLAGMILYFYLLIFISQLGFQTPLSTHVWRIGMMLGIGIIFNGVIALVQAAYETRLRR